MKDIILRMIDLRALIPFWSHKEGHVYRRLVEKKQAKHKDWISDRSALGVAIGFFVLLVSFPAIFFSVANRASVAPTSPAAISPVLCKGQCMGDSGGSEYIEGLLCTNKNNTACLTCESNGKFSQSPIGSCTVPGGQTTFGPSGSCSGPSWNYSYTDCCSEGKSRTVTRTCRDGKYYWNYDSCTTGDGQCRQKGTSTVVCPPQTAYVAGKCYPLNECVPSCNNKACGAADGCGGVCVESCGSQDEANRTVAKYTLGGSYKYAYSATNYGAGFYTNLCGDTITATKTCTSACDPTTGVCTSNKPFIVKWVCDGKSIECREGESAWKTTQSIAGAKCGQTVQIDVFSKNCRAGGANTWSCGIKELVDYMVWYSGDCSPRPTPNYSPTPTPSPAATPTSTVTPTPRVVYKYIYVTPSPTPTPKNIGGAPLGASGTTGSGALCNASCTTTSQCAFPNVCTAGSCRNPSCVADATCSCSGVDSGAGVTTTPADLFGGLLASPAPTPGCGMSCSYPIDCPSGFTCASGACRNASCPTSVSCSCDEDAGAGISPTVSPDPVQTTSGQGSVWMIILLIVVIVVVVVVAVKFFLFPH